MFTFLIIADKDCITDSVYEAFSSMGMLKKEKERRLFVESSTGMKGGWIAFQPIENVQYDYEPNEIEALKHRIKTPSFFLVEGRDGTDKFSDTFIQKFCPPGKVLIDNDHGMIADLAEVKRKIKSGADWLHVAG